MSDDYASIRARILEMVPTEQAPFVEFELRMLTTTLESQNLQYIHQHWRPIAADRDKLREQLASLKTKPERPARSAPTETPDVQVRFDALSVEHGQLQTKHKNLEQRHTDLKELYETLVAQHKQLQHDCDELLADKIPRRTA
jgi:predicted nuclease with TOPRIM domain